MQLSAIVTFLYDCAAKQGDNLRKFTTITDEEFVTNTWQSKVLGRWVLCISFVVYVSLMVAFSYASPEYIASLQPYFFNPPDFSRCEPTFSARVTAHIVFAYLAMPFCSFVLLVSILARWQNGQLLSYKPTNVAGFGLLLFFASLPIFSNDFLLASTGRGRSRVTWHFVDFCERSWDLPAMVYLIVLGGTLLVTLIALGFSIAEFVLSGNQQWTDSLSTDPHARATQLAIRLEYGQITKEEFNQALQQFNLKPPTSTPH